MRRLRKRWTLIAIFSALALLLIFLFAPNRPATPVVSAVSIDLLGFTNVPGSDRKFGIFSITNRAEYDVRWHGDWVEIEGKPEHQGRIFNNLLPGRTYTPVLKSHESFVLNIGEPFYGFETGRWRFVTSFTRYDVRERWHDLAMKGKAPNHIGRFVFVDSQKLLNPTNHTHANTIWFTKAEQTAGNQ
jgi:hypothetical protein